MPAGIPFRLHDGPLIVLPSGAENVPAAHRYGGDCLVASPRAAIQRGWATCLARQVLQSPSTCSSCGDFLDDRWPLQASASLLTVQGIRGVPFRSLAAVSGAGARSASGAGGFFLERTQGRRLTAAEQSTLAEASPLPAPSQSRILERTPCPDSLGPLELEGPAG